ncbi:unnamed protein product [Closterium sp. Naga37s-1]|nr:unnamed protein product [Closterium sp. Naga37s-1]
MIPLKPFRSSLQKVQRMAVGIVAGLTGSDEGLSKLLPEADVIAAALLPLLSANKEISLPSAQALVNLSQHDVAAKAVIKARGVETAGGMAVGRGGAGGGGGGKGKNAGLMVMLLANLTQLDEGAEKLLEPSGSVPLLASLTRRFAMSADREEWQEDDYEHPSGSVPLLASLTRRFAMSADREEWQEDDYEHPSGSVPLLASLTRRFAMSADREEGQEDEYEHVATILVNATRLEAARKLLLDPEKKLLRQILPQTSSSNRIRSQGPWPRVAMATMSTDLDWPYHCQSCTLQSTQSRPVSLTSSPMPPSQEYSKEDREQMLPELAVPLSMERPPEYSKEDRDQMPPELAVPLSMERPPVTDAKLRADAADALFLIASEEAGRKALWAVHGARILQVGYEDEEADFRVNSKVSSPSPPPLPLP